MVIAVEPFKDFRNLKPCCHAVHTGDINSRPAMRSCPKWLIYGFPTRAEKAVAACGVQLDFKDSDSNGNFRLNHYHQNYGFDLESVLSKHPIKELQNESHKEDLMNSLKKGNLQSATFLKEDKEVRQYIEANPQFKTLNIYDADHKRLDMKHGKDQEQSQRQDTSQKESRGNKQTANEGEAPGEEKQKKQRRKSQSM